MNIFFRKAGQNIRIDLVAVHIHVGGIAKNGGKDVGEFLRNSDIFMSDSRPSLDEVLGRLKGWEGRKVRRR
jgi:hypothetical protein